MFVTGLSQNDWRYYLAHAESRSKYDWSTGKNPPDYNHDYWEKNKEKILAQRKAKNGGVRSDFEVGYKAKTDDGKSYNNDTDWSDELTDEELKNIELHNAQVEKNIADITKTVNDYLRDHPDLPHDKVSNLKRSLQTQIEIAREQMISTRNGDDYNYIMGLRKKNSAAKKSSSSRKSSSGSSKKSSGSSKRSSNSGTGKSSDYKTANSRTDGIGIARKPMTNVADLKRYDYQVNKLNRNR